jgi:hypothetical protein
MGKHEMVGRGRLQPAKGQCQTNASQNSALPPTGISPGPPCLPGEQETETPSPRWGQNPHLARQAGSRWSWQSGKQSRAGARQELRKACRWGDQPPGLWLPAPVPS